MAAEARGQSDVKELTPRSSAAPRSQKRQGDGFSHEASGRTPPYPHLNPSLLVSRKSREEICVASSHQVHSHLLQRPSLGSYPSLFPAEAVAFTQQGQWSRGGEAGGLGSKMGRGDEGRGEGGHLGQARAEHPAGEEAAGRPLSPGVSPWLTVPRPCPPPDRHHHQPRAPGPLAVIRVLCQVNAGFCAQVGSRKDTQSVIREAGSQPYEGSHKSPITRAASTGNATPGFLNTHSHNHIRGPPAGSPPPPPVPSAPQLLRVTQAGPPSQLALAARVAVTVGRGGGHSLPAACRAPRGHSVTGLLFLLLLRSWLWLHH